MLRAIQCNPVGDFKEIIQRSGMVLRQSENGFQLYAPTDESISSYLEQLSNTYGITAFHFDITVEDYEFYNYTNLPLDRAVSFSFSSADPQNNTHGALTNLHPSLEEVGDNNQLGKLHIAFSDMFVLTTIDAPVAFAISFTQRATQWHYYLIISNLLDLYNLRIVNDDGFTFDVPTDAVLPNGGKALLITSNVLIPLNDYNKYNLELIFDEQRIKLPNASAAQIGMFEIEGAQWATSDIYVYL
jgi:hypothetical protein